MCQMNEQNENYRGHAIIPGVSGPSLNNGPLVAFYTVWKIEKITPTGLFSKVH